MSFVSTYKPLFTIALWHHYFLDDGTIAFDSDTSLQEEQLASFNFKNLQGSNDVVSSQDAAPVSLTLDLNQTSMGNPSADETFVFAMTDDEADDEEVL